MASLTRRVLFLWSVKDRRPLVCESQWRDRVTEWQNERDQRKQTLTAHAGRPRPGERVQSGVEGARLPKHAGAPVGDIVELAGTHAQSLHAVKHIARRSKKPSLLFLLLDTVRSHVTSGQKKTPAATIPPGWNSSTLDVRAAWSRCFCARERFLCFSLRVSLSHTPLVSISLSGWSLAASVLGVSCS